MDRNSLSTQLQSNSSQTKCLIQSLSDQSLSGNRQSNRFNGSRRRHNEAIHKNVTQSTQSGRQSSAQWRSGRSRGSGSVAGVVDCDFWSDHLNGDSTAPLSEKLDNKKTYGSKKHNLNHLLNFTFDSRDQIRSGDHQRGGHQRRGHHRGYNKEHFLQANCQFVVNDLNDYSIHLSNPDTSVDWNSVEEIRFNSLTAETYCPICLDSPVAPKMTRCGHIFCWSCALHYLALSDQKWRKCPICFDWIQSEDLRTVSSINKIDYKIGDFITLSLMKRKKGSTVTSPAILYDVNHNSFEPLDGDPVISSYRKILIASPNQVLDQIIERERQQLLNQMIVDKDTPEVCFIENALDQLKVREDMVQQRCQLNTIDGSSADTGVGEDNVDNRSDDDYYYFYQSEDGQHIYLHSLNVRILKQEFGSLESCPHKICAKIVETEWESMSEELRKRHRYLQHLPLTCEFRIVELEFNNELISEATLELFRAEVMNRQRMRSKRAREERRRERHIQVEQNKRIHGIYPRPKYMLDNMDQFPVCSQTPDALNPNSAFNLSESSTVEDASLQPNYGTSPAAEPEFPSFATMLREGKQNFAQTMTASKKATVNSKDLATNESDDEYQRLPTAHYSLSDAFAAALQLQLSTDPQNDGNKKGSKKKKNKPKLLLSTGMNRKY
ncbi:unnamed protein product [Medioppia subpectinata]|uniref:E3 ubiquitin-protein ligase RNF10 n=1 Tax=Medioppia subpectinata TaxID=1979941 RepID=A0A7R9KT94_9ACAR|nr:unnamed protein product [Medioppia subpectinata]CAG2108018.1 unnamed protein product [Medioppia subpectinata]